jgi:hypothetical protein
VTSLLSALQKFDVLVLKIDVQAILDLRLHDELPVLGEIYRHANQGLAEQ